MFSTGIDRRDDAIDGCERILNDEFKDYPESAFYMIGSIDEAKTGSAKKNNVEHDAAKVPEQPQPAAVSGGHSH